MVEPAQDRAGEDFTASWVWWQWFRWRLWSLLLDALMRPGSVEVVHIHVEHALELLLLEDEQMIEALAPDTAQEAVLAIWNIRSMTNEERAAWKTLPMMWRRRKNRRDSYHQRIFGNGCSK